MVLCGIAVALTACSVKAVTYTPGDDQPPDAQSSRPAEDCTTPGDEDGNGLADCADPACASAAACQPVCGNGKVEAGEACDDGNQVNGDACEADCTLPVCGNSIVDQGEACDDGASNGALTSTCSTTCHLVSCGNGVIEQGEACDDGNTVNGDACEANCTLPRCGNGIVDPSEACDDGNKVNGDACENDCTAPRCGNGIVDPGEACDDGNTANGDECSSTCQNVSCTASLVPAMTSPTTPSGQVFRSGVLDSGDEAWQAFDRSTSTQWISALDQTPAQIGYQFGDGPHKVKSYAITFVNGSLTSRAPRDWTFEGWDGAAWVVVDTRSGQTNWLGVEKRTFTVATPGIYSMYRLNITEDNDPRPDAPIIVISMGELDFVGCP